MTPPVYDEPDAVGGPSRNLCVECRRTTTGTRFTCKVRGAQVCRDRTDCFFKHIESHGLKLGKLKR